MFKYKVTRDRCDAVAGNPRGGKFLFKQMRWTNITDIVRDNHKWVALSYERWAKELDCSFTQFKYLLEQMVADEKVVRAQYMFKGKKVLHVRFTDECFQALISKDAPIKQMGKGTKQMGTTGPTHVGTTAPTQVGESAQMLYNSESKLRKSTQIATGFAVATPEAEKFDKTPGEEDNACNSKNSGYHPEVGKIIPILNGQGGPAVMATANEIAAGILASSKKSIDTLQPDKVASLVWVYRQGMIEKGLTVPTITDKMYGQLKTLIKALPEGKAPEIVAFAVDNWGDFTYEAKSECAAWDCPQQPAIYFLLKYQHVAVDLWKKSLAKAAAAKPVIKSPVQSIAQKPAEPADDDKPMTWEQLQALEAAELEAGS
jgi:hypothetical protein